MSDVILNIPKRNSRGRSLLLTLSLSRARVPRIIRRKRDANVRRMAVISMEFRP
jgi:hypothetical protein